MEKITFQDTAFAKAALSQLGSAKEPVTKEDLQQIEGLLITHDAALKVYIPWYDNSWGLDIPARDHTGIHSDEYPWEVQMIVPNLKFNVGSSDNGKWERDLQYFSHIKTLHLYAPTGGLGLLGKFTHLQELYIVDSRTKDWSFIRNLINLRLLFISTCDDDLNVNPICELSKSHNRLSHVGVEYWIDGLPPGNPLAEFIELELNASFSNRSMREGR
ncbi:hypothetical protein FHR92_003765 [Fontibacillus solani]|uniref:Uncharacterized protein n=1 Tax=Fontibacillus solani TaxID=1572857 RepID=A0A7W3SVZ7_9BACL|nr:hypothetical protein [Fontibacillus solani]MBA9087281.1 hypothetical protein [Fontibacillus solani]